jgi:hypothetical protein
MAQVGWPGFAAVLPLLLTILGAAALDETSR